MDRIHEPRAAGRQVVADKFQSKIDSIQGAPPIQLPAAPGDGNRPVVEFPARLVPKDPRDAYIVDKESAYKFEQEKVEANGGGQQIVRTVGPEDVDYLRRKRAVMNRLEFDKWMTKAIDMTDPVAGKLPNPYSGTKPFRSKRRK